MKLVEVDFGDKDFGEEFIVKESRAINAFMGIIFFVVFMVTICSGDKKTTFDIAWKILFLLFPSIFFLNKASSESELLKINKDGIYSNGDFVTNWNNFIEAEVKQQLLRRNVSETTKLIIRYYKNAYDYPFRLTIILSATSNQSEEAVIAAIKHYRVLSNN